VKQWALRLAVGFLAAAVLVVLAGYAYWHLSLRDQAIIGVNYAAKSLCSCVFVEGRSDAACLDDLDPAARDLEIDIDRRSAEVRVSLPLLAEAVARVHPGMGCRLEP